jgi:hypothetical protein
MPAEVLLFSCRLCGLTVEVITPDAVASVKGLPVLNGWHDCGGGAVGVTDLIGAKTLAPDPAVEAQASQCRSQDAA